MTWPCNRSAPLWTFPPVRKKTPHAARGRRKNRNVYGLGTKLLFLGTNLTEVDFFPLFWLLVLNRESVARTSTQLWSGQLSLIGQRAEGTKKRRRWISYHDITLYDVWYDWNIIWSYFDIKKLIIKWHTASIASQCRYHPLRLVTPWKQCGPQCQWPDAAGSTIQNPCLCSWQLSLWTLASPSQLLTELQCQVHVGQ